jgi:hypothetical protein
MYVIIILVTIWIWQKIHPVDLGKKVYPPYIVRKAIRGRKFYNHRMYLIS